MLPRGAVLAAIAIANAALLLHGVQACSDFKLNSSLPDTTISARTMDFVADLRTVVEVIPRGTTFHELPVFDCADCPDYQWQSKYGFVAMNIFGLNVATDGMNEHGLSAAWLYLDATEYPTPQRRPQRDPNVPIVTSLCTYLLGNYATVEEVKAGLSTFQIAEFDERIEVLLLHDASLGRVPLHVSVHDATGKSMVIEFLHGETKVYDNFNHILANDPPFEEQLQLLQANGLNRIPGGYGSTQRFLRLSVLNHHASAGYSNAMPGVSYMAATTEQRGVSDALHILNSVVRPPLQEATEWSIVRDHLRRKLYIQSTQNQVLRVVDLKQLDFARVSSRHLVPVTAGSWYVDMTGALQDPASSARTTDLPPRPMLEQMLRQLLRSETFPPSMGSTIASLPRGMSPCARTSADSILNDNVATQQSSHLWGFTLGIFSGAFMAVAIMVASRAAALRRQHPYQRIAEPKDVSFVDSHGSMTT